MALVHQFGQRIGGLSTARPQSARAAGAGRSAGGSARRRVDGRSPGRRTRSAPAGRRRAPRRSRRREWATRHATVPSGSMANVSISAWTITWARRGDPKSATIGVAERCSQRGSPSRRRGRTCGTRRPRPAAGRVPVQAARLVVDGGREARRPGPARPLEAQLGSTQRHRDRRSTRGPRSIRVPPASLRAKTAATGRCRPSASAPGGPPDR